MTVDLRKVFISYSYKDREFVERLASDLQTRGIRVWYDRLEINVGDSIIEKIEEGIGQSAFVLIILSRNSVSSTWVQKEIKFAFQRSAAQAERVFIPVVVGDVDIPAFLRDIRYVDLSNEALYERGLDEIVRAIKGAPAKKKTVPTDLINIEDLAKEIAKEIAHFLKVTPQGFRESVEQQEGNDPNLVFVITSFSAEMEPIFEGIQAAGEANGLRVERVKDVLGDYRITDKIIEMIHQSRLIVADLTHERPNVYFELGYARGLGKTVITTAREGTNLHFDVKDWTCTFYNDSRVLEQHLKKRFAFELDNTK